MCIDTARWPLFQAPWRDWACRRDQSCHRSGLKARLAFCFPAAAALRVLSLLKASKRLGLHLDASGSEYQLKCMCANFNSLQTDGLQAADVKKRRSEIGKQRAAQSLTELAS